MKVQELLSKSDLLMQKIDPDLLHLEGAVASEDSGARLRIYADPRQNSKYMLINATDIVGEIVPLDKQYIDSIGMTGFQLFRITVRHGAQAQSVMITNVKLGETVRPPQAAVAKSAAMGRCEATWGCTSGCCTYASDGQCYCDRCCIG